jgi:hypothetical protein
LSQSRFLRECLDHVVVFWESHLRHLMANHATTTMACARTWRLTSLPDRRFRNQMTVIDATTSVRVFDKIRTVRPGAIVENKRLGAMLALVKENRPRSRRTGVDTIREPYGTGGSRSKGIADHPFVSPSRPTGRRRHQPYGSASRRAFVVS